MLYNMCRLVIPQLNVNPSGRAGAKLDLDAEGDILSNAMRRSSVDVNMGQCLPKPYTSENYES